jgi:hypothetical protein
MSLHIVDEEQRRDRDVTLHARWVPAWRGHLLRWRSFTMHTTSSALRRLESALARPGTRLLLILGQSPSSPVPGFSFAAVYPFPILYDSA